jgi:hypothetical protein
MSSKSGVPLPPRFPFLFPLLRHCACALLFGLTAAWSVACYAATLKAAVAKVNITPPVGLPMYGFFERLQEGKVSNGLLDPLYARVLVLGDGQKRLALITLDLGRTFGATTLDRLRRMIQASSGISFMIITASHTHSGPNIVDHPESGPPSAWEQDAINKIAAAVHRAGGQLVDARIGTGYGSAYVAYNRRLVSLSGAVTMLWMNPEMRPTSPLDPTLSVLRIDDAAGKPLAILVNYACHPVIFGADNLKYSADFVGVMANRVEQSFDGAPICFFLQGADGDINPYYATTPMKDNAIAKRDWTGNQLGEAAARVARTIRTETPDQPTIQFSDDVMQVGWRWNPTILRQLLLKSYGPRIFEDHADLLAFDPPPRQLQLHVTTLLLSKHIAFLGMSGEPFVEFQINWRDRCPAKDAFFLGYSNGYFDYLPTIRAASEGGYGAADSNTYVEIGAGERMLRQALVRVYEMLGKLSDTPELN